MNINSLIKQYEEELAKVRKKLKKYDGSLLGTKPTLQESIDIAVIMAIISEMELKIANLKTLQTEMREWIEKNTNTINLYEYSGDVITPENILEAFGLEEIWKPKITKQKDGSTIVNFKIKEF